MTEGFKTLLEIIKAGAVNNIEMRNIMFPDYQAYVKEHGIDNEKTFASYLEELDEDRVIEVYKTFMAQKEACISALCNDLVSVYMMLGYKETQSIVANKLSELLKEDKESHIVDVNNNIKLNYPNENKPSLKEQAKSLNLLSSSLYVDKLTNTQEQTFDTTIDTCAYYAESDVKITNETFDHMVEHGLFEETTDASEVDTIEDSVEVADENELLKAVDDNAQKQPSRTETFFDDFDKPKKDSNLLRTQLLDELKSMCPRIPQLTYKSGYEACYEDVLYLADYYFKVELTQEKLTEFANDVSNCIKNLDTHVNTEYKDGFTECISDVGFIVKKYEDLLVEC